MSGGHFNYAYSRMSELAEELKHEIDINDDTTQNQYGEARGYGFGKDTIERLTVIHSLIETAVKLAREVEWLYSGDHGEESFNKLVDQICQENNEKNGRESYEKQLNDKVL